MNTVAGIIIAIVAIVLFAIWCTRRRHGANLRQRFGPSCAGEVRAHGSERDADQFFRDRCTPRRQAVQSQFIDRPGAALNETDELVTDVMHDHGHRLYPKVVKHYRALFDELARER
jgi:hypothetical protein